MVSTPASVIGLEFRMNRNLIVKTGKILRFYDTLPSEQSRHHITSCHLVRGYSDMLIAGLLSNTFDILTMQDYFYAGSAKLDGNIRDFYVPNEFKHLFKSGIMLNY